jgi:hypothetical protein
MDLASVIAALRALRLPFAMKNSPPYVMERALHARVHCGPQPEGEPCHHRQCAGSA